MTQPDFLRLPTARTDARVVLVGVPFDATTSYRPGTAHGPLAVLEASAQVDLEDLRLGRICDRGIVMEPIEGWIAELSSAVRPDAEVLIEVEGEPPVDEDARGLVNAASERLRAYVRERVAEILSEGKTPGLVGGEHSVPLGAIEACARHAGEIGILQVDAHMDLRDAYCGLAHSHASIMRNALTMVPGVKALAQIGIRDYCREELEFAHSARDTLGKPVTTVFGEDISDTGGDPVLFKNLVERALETLPDTIYVTFDIDALEVYLCPNTGTPVPGGLSFSQAAAIIKAVIDSGKKVVGFDLVEVAPDPDPGVRSIDAVVGARVLYKMCALGA
jgi:agmatinase